MSNTLLPCPFCGRTPKVLQRPDSLDGYFCAISCFCGGYSSKAYCSAIGADEPEAYMKAALRWNRRVDARQLALKTRVCPMCEDCPDGCPVETPKDSRNIVTNAQRIRSAQDNEIARELLAMYLHGHCDCNEENGFCVTEQGLIDWLRQPAETEGME